MHESWGRVHVQLEDRVGEEGQKMRQNNEKVKSRGERGVMTTEMWRGEAGSDE